MTCVMVCRAGGCYGVPFRGHRGVTQGDNLSPRIFNVVVDAVIREWLHHLIGEEVAWLGIRFEVRNRQVLFFADDGLLASRDPTWLQNSFDILISLFECVGLKTNAVKTKAMVCCLTTIAKGLSEEAYNSCQLGGTTAPERRRRRV